MLEKDNLQEKIDAIIQAGTAENTRRAYESDQRRFWDWVGRELGLKESYPVHVSIILRYIVEHLTTNNPQQALKISTLKRYLASISVAHQERGLATPTSDPDVKILMRRAKRALPNQRPRKKAAATLDVLQNLFDTCGNSLWGLRDRAIIAVGFACGGRRRSELAALRIEDLEPIEHGYLVTINKSKNDQDQKGLQVPITGLAAQYLSDWLVASDIQEGPVFRGILPNGALHKAINDRTINRIMKDRAEKAGYDPRKFGAHSLRAGYLTTAANEGIDIFSAMKLSGHKTLEVAKGYIRNDGINDRAANLLNFDKIYQRKTRT